MKYVFATFTKLGNLRYISHLDLQRAFTRLMLRTELPIKFSEGFNPHPKLMFAQPLSLFQESICEVAEFRMEDECPTEEETLARLQAQAPEGLNFLKVEFFEKKLPPCKAAWYTLTFETTLEVEAFSALFAGEMPVLKKTKTQEKMMDIAPLITERSFAKTENGVALHCVLPCGNEYLNPVYVQQFLGENVTDMRVMREKLVF
ncbi:MAG: TIGR03936 family radical SAM-associated protein [Clostridia bacterium]|nr:TIGR03936 family radical SAM-associated protein [Clostridia bacterium]